MLPRRWRRHRFQRRWLMPFTDASQTAIKLPQAARLRVADRDEAARCPQYARKVAQSAYQHQHGIGSQHHPRMPSASELVLLSNSSSVCAFRK